MDVNATNIEEISHLTVLAYRRGKKVSGNGGEKTKTLCCYAYKLNKRHS